MNGEKWIEKPERKFIGRRVTTREGYRGVIMGRFGDRGTCFMIHFDADISGQGLHIRNAADCEVGRPSQCQQARDQRALLELSDG